MSKRDFALKAIKVLRPQDKLRPCNVSFKRETKKFAGVAANKSKDIATFLAQHATGVKQKSLAVAGGAFAS